MIDRANDLLWPADFDQNDPVGKALAQHAKGPDYDREESDAGRGKTKKKSTGGKKGKGDKGGKDYTRNDAEAKEERAKERLRKIKDGDRAKNSEWVICGAKVSGTKMLHAIGKRKGAENQARVMGISATLVRLVGSYYLVPREVVRIMAVYMLMTNCSR